jgi:hypothetical protein
MSTTAQIQANRNNAQLSTGARTEQGRERSAVNATRHGFCGQHLIVPVEEKEAYENHTIAVVEQYQPRTHQEASLIQQYADMQWTLHQINVLQINVMSMLNAATSKLMKDGADFDTMNASLAPFYKQIGTLGVYEQRKRRAAQETLAQYNDLVEARLADLAKAAQTCKVLKAQGKPFTPAEFGFVYALPEVESYIAREAVFAEAEKLLKRA